MVDWLPNKIEIEIEEGFWKAGGNVEIRYR